MMEVPFRYARDRVVKHFHSFLSFDQSPDTVHFLQQTSRVSGRCMVSESLERFAESNSEDFEFALKASSATAFIGE